MISRSRSSLSIILIIIIIPGVPGIKISGWSSTETYSIGKDAGRIFLIQQVIDPGEELQVKFFRKAMIVGSLQVQQFVAGTESIIGIIKRCFPAVKETGINRKPCIRDQVYACINGSFWNSWKGVSGIIDSIIDKFPKFEDVESCINIRSQVKSAGDFEIGSY